MEVFIFLGIILLIVALVYYSNKSQPKRDSRTIKELDDLEKGVHFFEFQLSKPKPEVIKALADTMMSWNRAGVEIMGDQWEFKDNSIIDYWHPEEGRAIYLYTEHLIGEPEDRLIGFVPYEFYDWFVYFHRNRDKFTLSLEFDPVDQIVYFQMIKMTQRA